MTTRKPSRHLGLMAYFDKIAVHARAARGAVRPTKAVRNVRQVYQILVLAGACRKDFPCEVADVTDVKNSLPAEVGIAGFLGIDES